MKIRVIILCYNSLEYTHVFRPLMSVLLVLYIFASCGGYTLPFEPASIALYPFFRLFISYISVH
jgi:hypothetical protein